MTKLTEEQQFKVLLQKSHFEIPDRNFEDRIMQKIEFAYSIKLQRRKNLRLSWLFMFLSAILLPALLLFLSHAPLSGTLSKLGVDLAHAGSVLLPAGALLSAILILVQIDNLLRLTLRMR